MKTESFLLQPGGSRAAVVFESDRKLLQQPGGCSAIAAALAVLQG